MNINTLPLKKLIAHNYSISKFLKNIPAKDLPDLLQAQKQQGIKERELLIDYLENIAVSGLWHRTIKLQPSCVEDTAKVIQKSKQEAKYIDILRKTIN